jgi:hypothetical protein
MSLSVGAAEVDRLPSLMKDHNAPQSVLDGTVIGRNCSATATRSSSASPTAGAPVHRAVRQRPLIAHSRQLVKRTLRIAAVDVTVARSGNRPRVYFRRDSGRRRTGGPSGERTFERRHSPESRVFAAIPVSELRRHSLLAPDSLAGAARVFTEMAISFIKVAIDCALGDLSF